MEWSKLLCGERIRTSASEEKKSKDMRTEFEKDYHRIIGSAAFRRLQDKTQVFPLDKSDFVRTRLTHSLEVSSFAKSLGQNVSERIIEEKRDSNFDYHSRDAVCDILQCAGLIHDIGNPPFGHFGETVIREWFLQNMELFKYKDKSLSEWLTPQMKNDFYHFEGNTQALRQVTKLHYLVDEHGMNLTKALLATIIKYPVSSENINPDSGDICTKKMGYFYADEDVFKDIEDSMGLNGRRHPLAYLLEAADDIAYATADIEDACKKGMLNFIQLKDELLKCNLDKSDRKLVDNLEEKFYERGQEAEVDNPGEYAVQNWIIRVQGRLIYAATDAFMDNYDSIMDGSFDKELLSTTDAWALLKGLKDIAYRYAFLSSSILKKEIAAEHMLSYILNELVAAAIPFDTDESMTSVQQKWMSIISDNYKKIYKVYSEKENRSEQEKLYMRLLLVTDFVSGMTDSYARNLYQEMSAAINIT